MEKYYRTENTKTRSNRNEELYEKIYDMGDYSNIEGIADIEKTNEIDIRKIKELLKEKEQTKVERSIVKEVESVEIDESFEEEKNYDIREILNKAKSSRVESENIPRRLNDTQYNILKSLKIKDKINDDNFLEEENELKELINTITNTSMLNKLGDKELSLNMFEDLRSSGNTIVLQEPTLETVESNEKIELDKSFYTSSLNFKEEDFEELKEINNTLKKNNTLIKVLLTFLVLIIISIIVFVVINYFGL